jgi:hypothetical protein
MLDRGQVMMQVWDNERHGKKAGQGIVRWGQTYQEFPSVFAPLFSANLRSCAALN